MQPSAASSNAQLGTVSGFSRGRMKCAFRLVPSIRPVRRHRPHLHPSRRGGFRHEEKEADAMLCLMSISVKRSSSKPLTGLISGAAGTDALALPAAPAPLSDTRSPICGFNPAALFSRFNKVFPARVSFHSCSEVPAQPGFRALRRAPE